MLSWAKNVNHSRDSVLSVQECAVGDTEALITELFLLASSPVFGKLHPQGQYRALKSNS